VPGQPHAGRQCDDARKRVDDIEQAEAETARQAGAPAVPELSAAAIGVTETSRKKLVSMHNSDPSTSANEPLTSRGWCAAGLFMAATVGPVPDG